MLSKPELRSHLRKLRQEFVKKQLLSFDESISDIIDWQNLINRHRSIAGYLAVGSEVNILTMLERLAASGISLSLPSVASRDAPLQFRQWSPADTLESASFGFLQPLSAAQTVTPELILVPLVGFDRAMNRLGQGAGHYDRAFVRFPDALRVGVAWSVQEVPDIPTESWDVPLDAILTEKEWISNADSRINC